MSSNVGNLFNRTLGILGQSLTLRQARHGMTTSNLANIDTPNYRVRDIRFEQTLQNALGRQEGALAPRQTNPLHMPQKDVEAAYRNSGRDTVYSYYGQDEKGNDVVDIDMEMTKLAKNHLIYNATVQMLAKEYENLKYAIGEGGR
jgi:flagellar basal-body rod protein FlgB